MTEIRTRDEALAAIDRGLGQWAAMATGIISQATAVASAAQTAADSKVRYLAGKVAAIEARLGSLRPTDDPRPLRRDLAKATDSLQLAQEASQQIVLVARQLATIRRTQLRSNDAEVRSARADLSRRFGALGSYRDSGSGGSGMAASAGASPDGRADWLGGRGLSEVDVAAAEFADNPIAGHFGRGGASLADYRWAVQTWDEVVRPGVARGMTRADFEARDVQGAAPRLRRTASVYDLFLGDADRLLVSRRPGGGLDVTNGRHRFQVARDLGIKYLPAQVAEA